MTSLPIVDSSNAPNYINESTSSTSFSKKLDLGFGKEVSFIQLGKALTFRRIWNVLQMLAALLLSILTKRPIVWGVPPVLTIEPTNICNLRCPLCVTGNGTMERSYGRMDFDTFTRLIDEIGDRVLYLVFFNQGEPYLHRRLNEFVAYAKRRGIYVTTSTNVHYFDAETAEATVRSGMDTLVLSVDGATQATYAHYRVGGSLVKVQQGIRALVEAKQRLRSKTPYLYIQFLVMQHNEHEIPAMERMAAELGVDRLLKKNTQVETLEEARDWLPQEEKYRRYHLAENDFIVKRGKGICVRPWLTTMVNWDGSVVPCCFDKNGRHTIGELRTSPKFLTIWKSDSSSNFRHQMLNERNAIDICKNCNQGIGLFI
ncbi:SPASM domain-containing protein [candidate division KSB1 bacterium]|nr:SPASM domain-containing protein [candidate division KSB1 bacterium]